MMNLIASVDERGAIGYQNRLLWHSAADKEYFRALTRGHSVVVGRKTFEHLPPLPERKIIVLTHQQKHLAEGEVVHDFKKIIQRAQTEEVWVIGGESVYNQAITEASRLYITHIHHTFPSADAYFPKINPEEWERVKIEKFEADTENPYAFEIIEYQHFNIKKK